MEPTAKGREKVTLVTLGPTGTCHERGASEDMGCQGVEDFDVNLIDDFLDGPEWIRGKDNAFTIPCSASPKVYEIPSDTGPRYSPSTRSSTRPRLWRG